MWQELPSEQPGEHVACHMRLVKMAARSMTYDQKRVLQRNDIYWSWYARNDTTEITELWNRVKNPYRYHAHKRSPNVDNSPNFWTNEVNKDHDYPKKRSSLILKDKLWTAYILSICS